MQLNNEPFSYLYSNEYDNSFKIEKFSMKI